MNNLIIEGRAPMRAPNINKARAMAHWIAKKDQVKVVIECALKCFESITVFPCGKEVEGD